MAELRRAYREDLREISDELLAMGSFVLDMLDEVTLALGAMDPERAAEVIASDDELDRRYRQVQENLMTTLALQAPVASDLRRIAASIQVASHVERMGDLCVNIARFVHAGDMPVGDESLLAQLEEMSRHARRLIARALEAFGRADLAQVAGLPALDDPLDNLNRSVFVTLVRLAATDEARLEWALRMVLVARAFERLGDHAVEIGGHTHYIVTGEIVELTGGEPAAVSRNGR
ncbi:MAG: phosphate signaling complex protein PhoU [Egibacteraceae bacterium]